MFKVYEMMGNFSKEVAMFETEVEAYEYCEDRASENTVSELGCDIASDDLKAYEMEYENQMSYFSIEDDGREPISEDDVIEQYEDAMDEEDIIVCGMSFQASRILKELDPIAYNCGLSDYYDLISDSYYCEGME
jgi:hypothetical protein